MREMSEVSYGVWMGCVCDHPSASSSVFGGSGCSSNLGVSLGVVCLPVALNALVSFRNVDRAFIPSSVPSISGRNMSLDRRMSASRFPAKFMQSRMMWSRVCICSPHGHSCSSLR